MKTYKGFDKNLKCRGFQYEIGKEYETDTAKACESGFHACENPLDVFDYYPPADSRYCEVEQSGELDKGSDDSKIASTKIKIGAEIGLSGLIKAGVKFILEKVKKETSDIEESSCGDEAQIGSCGNGAQIGSSGYGAKISSCGDEAQIGSCGNGAQIGSSGYGAKIGSSGVHAATRRKSVHAATGRKSVQAATGRKSVQAATRRKSVHAATRRKSVHAARTASYVVRDMAAK